MSDKVRRLKKLVAVQKQVQALHEMRHAGHLAKAVEAANEAKDLGDRSDAGSHIAGLFADLYSKRIGQALDRETASRAEAAKEVVKIATETARGSIIERQHGDARRADDRAREDIDRLEIVGRSPGKPAAS